LRFFNSRFDQNRVGSGFESGEPELPRSPVSMLKVRTVGVSIAQRPVRSRLQSERAKSLRKKRPAAFLFAPATPPVMMPAMQDRLGWGQPLSRRYALRLTPRRGLCQASKINPLVVKTNERTKGVKSPWQPVECIAFAPDSKPAMNALI